MSARHRVIAVTAAALVAIAAGGCAIDRASLVSGHPLHPSVHVTPAEPIRTPTPEPATPPPTVTVAGHAVPASRAPTVAAALRAAGVTVPTGSVLAVVSRRALRSDGIPGHVLGNGNPAGPATPLAAGDVVTVVAGADRVEPTRTATVVVAAPNPSNLYVGGTPGQARVVLGAYSGEEVTRTYLVEPTPGHLVTPGAVALTFDDGPDATWTPQVLALLARAHVHAAFCLIGTHAAAHPDLVRAIAAGGHLLCDHTWDHDQQLPTRTPAQIRDEIARGAGAIVAAGPGLKPVFFRSPGGHWSPAVVAEAQRQHLVPLKWTVDPRDWSRPGTDTILRTVYRQVRPGGVILMHDGGGDRSQTLAALKILLTRLPAMGYTFVLPPTR